MAQQFEQQRQRQRGRSQEYERDYSDEDLGANDYRNFNDAPARNEYNPPGGGLGYAQGDYGQSYGRNRQDWREDFEEDMGDPPRAREYGHEYPGQRESWEPLRNRTGDLPSPAWWLTPGPHMGKGPQGWNRSKERIMEDVCERMAQHGQLDASNIRVDVNDGQVTLSGYVTSRREKRIAEDVAESVWGVNDVNNQIRVAESMPNEQRATLEHGK
jgi:hypothetical protein